MENEQELAKKIRSTGEIRLGRRMYLKLVRLNIVKVINQLILIKVKHK